MPIDRIQFPLNAKVRFVPDRLAVLNPSDRKRLEGRVGVVQGHLNHTRKPVVCFPADGSRGVLRLPGVDPRHIELVEESSVETLVEPVLAVATGDHGKLSQIDMDALFG